MKPLLHILSGTLFSSFLLAQQPLASPRDSTQIDLNGKRIFIDYGAPSKRGREIFGSLVPYTRWWRTGANEATSLKTDFDLLVGDTVLPKGAYTLYTLPSEKQWKLIINNQTGQWGTVYVPEMDFVRAPMKMKKLRDVVERMKITLEKNGENSVMLKIEWDRLLVWAEFKIVNGKQNGTK
jgi:hypothetical protein